jgi:opacity protein-like surface antigen
MYRKRLDRLSVSIHRGLYAATVLFCASIFPVHAEDEPAASKESAMSSKTALAPYDWSLEVGSGVQWSNIRASHQDGYTLIPANLTGALRIDDVSLDAFAGGLVRGYTEFLFQGYGDAITHGPAGMTRILGMNYGPRYNFVQPGWKLVPYVEGLVGFGFADSNPTVDAGGAAHGLGQDFNFTFGVGAGARYDIDEHWFVRFGVLYTHFSNAGLSEPQRENQPIDALGP